MDHVRRHLDDDLPLADLAEVAHFSPFHFHRIFQATTGETVADFVRRARLERAVHLMRAAPQRTLSSIAAETGFATPSDFSRLFRRQYGQTPSSWDRSSRLDGGPDISALARQRVVAEDHDAPGHRGEARIVRRPPLRLLYRRVRDPWQGDRLTTGYQQLTARMGELGLDWQRHHLVGVSWESGKATDLDRLVYDLGFAVGPDFNLASEAGGDDPFGFHQFEETAAVELSCGSLPETALAWDRLYEDWLPNSAYEPNDQPAMKRFHRLPETLAPDQWHVDCSIGLRPRRP